MNTERVRKTAADYPEMDSESVDIVASGDIQCGRYDVVKTKGGAYIRETGSRLPVETGMNTSILREIISQEKLKIDLYRRVGKRAGEHKNPHPLGREVIAALRKKRSIGRN